MQLEQKLKRYITVRTMFVSVLVAKECMQKEGVNCIETFLSGIRTHNTNKTFIYISCSVNLNETHLLLLRRSHCFSER